MLWLTVYFTGWQKRLHCRSLLPDYFMSSMCPAVSVQVNGFHIVALSHGNRLTPALLTDIALVSAVCLFI